VPAAFFKKAGGLCLDLGTNSKEIEAFGSQNEMLGDRRCTAGKQLETLLTAGALGSLTDGMLLERFLSGRGNADSSSAFAALVGRHGPMVLDVCRAVLRNLHDSEDAAQATFLVLARHGASIKRVDSLASWLFGVPLRVAARSTTEAARARAIERRGGEMSVRSTDGDSTEITAELHDELNRLPERFRAPIVLCHLEGLSNEQAAGQLGLPVRTVQRRLAQGRERLRARLVRRGFDPAAGVLGSGFAAPPTSEAWLEATVRAAAGLAAGQEIAAVASTAVTVLTQGVLTMMFIGRLKIAAVGFVAAAAVVVTFIGAGSAIAARRQPAQAPRLTPGNR
jgi:RNA polymerase sigma-70 factor (ECF subfamily)